MRKPDPKTPPSEARGPFRIHVVAEMTGAPAATLRAWERRYGVPRPARTASAYRLYDEHDVALVRTMMRLCSEGMSASDAARAARDLEPTLARTDRGAPDGVDPFATAVDRMIDAVKAFDADAFDRELGRAAFLGTAQDVYDRVAAPLLVRVGELWHAGTLSVAQEHLATERLVGSLQMQLRLLQSAPGARKVLLAGFADEEHVVGLLGAALAFAGFGYRVTLLGARTPPEAVRDAVAALAPELVGLSITIAPPPARAKALVRDYADAVAGTPWVVGGRGADAIGPLVEARGGIVARGPASEWPKLARGFMHARSNVKRRKKS